MTMICTRDVQNCDSELADLLAALYTCTSETLFEGEGNIGYIRVLLSKATQGPLKDEEFEELCDTYYTVFHNLMVDLEGWKDLLGAGELEQIRSFGVNYVRVFVYLKKNRAPSEKDVIHWKRIGCVFAQIHAWIHEYVPSDVWQLSALEKITDVAYNHASFLELMEC